MAVKLSRNAKRILVSALLCAVWAALFGLAERGFGDRRFGLYDVIVLWIQDCIKRDGKHATPDPRIVFLAIDEPTTSVGRILDEKTVASSKALTILESGFPFSREIYALAVNRLVEAGARVVAIDMIFPAPRDGDIPFRLALDNHAGHAVIGANFNDAENNKVFTEPSRTLIETAAQSDPRVGFVNFWPDVDEIVRQTRYRITAGQFFLGNETPDDAEYWSLGARMLQQSGFRGEIPKVPVIARAIRFGSEEGFSRHSLYKIFVPEDWKTVFDDGRYFDGKLVLIGPYGNFLKDQLQTPFGLVNGAELHLNAVNAALRNDFIRQLPRDGRLAAVIVAGAFAFLLSLPQKRPVIRFLALLAGSGAYIGCVFGLYAKPGVLFPVFAPVATFILSGVSTQVWQQALDILERLRTRRTLERYVSRNVVKELLDNPSPYLESLGGARKPVAMMFTDIRGFTALTEKADSHALVTQLNEYLTEMVRPVFESRGTLDKFIGDAIMAVWGNIQSEGAKKDVELCVSAALAMKENLGALNAKWKAWGMPELHMGIGINHGEVIVGNIGSQEKMDLTVIGDAVNLASRLEGTTKEYGVEIILGETAGELAADQFLVVPVDRVRVKGKAQPIEVFTVLGRKTPPPEPRLLEFAEEHARGLAAYRARDFAKASDHFTRCAGLVPELGLPGIYIERCRQMQLAPPPPDWGGVHVMDHK